MKSLIMVALAAGSFWGMAAAQSLESLPGILAPAGPSVNQPSPAESTSAEFEIESRPGPVTHYIVDTVESVAVPADSLMLMPADSSTTTSAK